MGPVSKAPELARDYLMTFGSDGGPGPELAAEGAGTGFGPFLCTINNQLRTGTDKGNLTV